MEKVQQKLSYLSVLNGGPHEDRKILVRHFRPHDTFGTLIVIFVPIEKAARGCKSNLLTSGICS